jgi:hypothetical protein
MYEEKSILNLKQAAELANRVTGFNQETTLYRPLSDGQLRSAIQEGKFTRMGIGYQNPPGRYYVSRRDLVVYLARSICAMCERAIEELNEEEVAQIEHTGVWWARQPQGARSARPGGER